MKARTKQQETNWEYADRIEHNYPSDTERSGKWLLFVPEQEIYLVWTAIKEATQSGLLGGTSKVSKRGRERAVCVYGYDYKDRHDVERIVRQLRAMGLERYGYNNKLRWKDDEQTKQGNYYYNSEGNSTCRYRSTDFP